MTISEKGSQSPPWAGRFSRPIVRSRFVVGDVHGCSRTLRKMIEDVLKLGPDDILYLLGDYIDRGPDSKGVLDYLIQLFMGDYDIRPLMGNHEEMLLEAASGNSEAQRIWFGNGGWGTMKQFGVDEPGDIPKRYIDFLARLPLSFSTDDYVMVHAGLDFRTADPEHDTPQSNMLWKRDFRVDPGKLGGRTLICGHTMTLLSDIRASLNGPHVCLDNGCWSKGEIGFGKLVAMDLDKRELLVQENCE